MGFFLEHFLPIVGVALFIAALAAVWAFGAAHNAKKRDSKMQAAQDRACETCSLASMCTRFGKEKEECEDCARIRAE